VSLGVWTLGRDRRRLQLLDHMHAVTEDEQPRRAAGMRRQLRPPRNDPPRHDVDQLEQPRVARHPIVVREPQPVDAMLPVLGQRRATDAFDSAARTPADEDSSSRGGAHAARPAEAHASSDALTAGARVACAPKKPPTC
jgi:hypothetical protein